MCVYIYIEKYLSVADNYAISFRFSTSLYLFTTMLSRLLRRAYPPLWLRGFDALLLALEMPNLGLPFLKPSRSTQALQTSWLVI